MVKFVKRFLYRRLSLDGYLRVLSCGFFAGYRLGVGRWFCRRSAAYEYPQFLRRIVRRGDVVIDIGANLGYYSRIFSRLVGDEGKVYAVEPVQPVLGVLERNLRGCRNVDILPFALGDADGVVTMVNDSASAAGYFGTGRNRGADDPVSANRLSKKVVGSPRGGLGGAEIERGGDGKEVVSAEAETAVENEIADELSGEGRMEFEAQMRRGSEVFAGLERLDFVKCDVEGYEGVVLGDLAAVIEKHRPVCLVETGGANRRRVIELFRTMGYAGYVLDREKLVSVMGVGGEKDIVFVSGGSPLPARGERSFSPSRGA